MKKLFIFLPIMFVVTLVFANKLFSGSTSKQVNKEINLAIYTDNNYSSAAYDSALAQVEVTVKKVIGNSVYTIASKKYDAVQLKQYANAQDAVTNTINISNIKDDNEYLLVTYTVMYDTKGSKLIFEKTEVIGKGEDHATINVVI